MENDDDDYREVEREMLYAIDTRRCPHCRVYLVQEYSMAAHDWVLYCPGCKWEMFGSEPFL